MTFLFIIILSDESYKIRKHHGLLSNPNNFGEYHCVIETRVDQRGKELEFNLSTERASVITEVFKLSFAYFYMQNKESSPLYYTILGSNRKKFWESQRLYHKNLDKENQ